MTRCRTENAVSAPGQNPKAKSESGLHLWSGPRRFWAKRTPTASLFHVAVFLSALVVVAAAQNATAYTSGGHSYDLTCNDNGYALTSRYPVSRMIGSGASSQVFERIETLYLGRDCDAFHELFGAGNWCWANGGFTAQFQAFRYGFPRQELSCPDFERGFELNCRCQ